jgi:hypothetical protein
MAARTWEGSSAPLAQDEAAEAQTPCRSSSTRSASLSTRSSSRWQLPATLPSRRPVSGTRARRPAGRRRGGPAVLRPGPPWRPLGHGGGQRGGEAGDAGHVVGAAPTLPLLPTAEQLRPQRGPLADHPAPHPLRAPELVGAHGDEPGGRRGAGVEPGDGLHGVGVQHRLRRVAGHDLGHPPPAAGSSPSRCSRASPTRAPRGRARAAAPRPDPRGRRSRPVDGRDGAASAATGWRTRGARRRCTPRCRRHLRRCPTRRGCRPRSHGGEHDLRCSAPEAVGDDVPRLVHDLAAGPGQRVRAGRVATRTPELVEHGRRGLGPQRRRRRVVEVGDHVLEATGRARPARACSPGGGRRGASGSAPTSGAARCW